VLGDLGLEEGIDETFQWPDRADDNILEAVVVNVTQQEQEIVSELVLVTGVDFYTVVQVSGKRDVHRFVVTYLPTRFVNSVLTHES
jgi:hypothetical protein